MIHKVRRVIEERRAAVGNADGDAIANVRGENIENMTLMG